MMFIAMIMMI